MNQGITANMDCSEFLDHISDFLDGDLSPETANRARRHQAACSACAAMFVSLRRTVDWFGDERHLAMPADVGARLRRRLEAELTPPGAAEPQRVPTPSSPPAVPPPSAPRAGGWWRSFSHRPAWAAALVALLVVVGFVRWRAAATTTTGWLMDPHCLTAYHGKVADHTRECLMECRHYGYGVLDAQGHFMPFDAQGNQRAYAMLKAAHRPNRIWITVHGKVANHTFDVQTIALSDPPAADLSQVR